MVMGYKTKVDWIESTVLDLLLLDWIQYYKDMHKFWDSFKTAYRNLVVSTGLRVFHKLTFPFSG